MSEKARIVVFPVSVDTGVSPEYPGMVVRLFVGADGREIVVVTPPTSAHDESTDLKTYGDKAKIEPAPALPRASTRRTTVARERGPRLDS